MIDGPARSLAVAGPAALVVDALPGAAEALTATELVRMRALRRAQDRLDFLAAHALARFCAARFAGVPAGRLTLLQRCPRCGADDHGRPSLRELPELHLSMSHTAGYVATIVGWRPVGVDAERPNRKRLDVSTVALTLTPAERARVDAATDRERAFLRLWVRKEALIKIGRVSLDTLTAVDLSELPIGEARMGTHRWHDLYLLDWAYPAEEVQGAAVAADPPQLRRFGHESGPWVEGAM